MKQRANATSFHGSVKLAGATCAIEECRRPAAAYVAGRDPDGEKGVMWFCDGHAYVADEQDFDVMEITRTCNRTAPGDTAPCGAMAGFVAFVGVADKLGSISLCETHLAEARALPPGE